MLISKDTSDASGAEFLCSWDLNNWMQVCVKEGNLTESKTSDCACILVPELLCLPFCFRLYFQALSLCS